MAYREPARSSSPDSGVVVHDLHTWMWIVPMPVIAVASVLYGVVRSALGSSFKTAWTGPALIIMSAVGLVFVMFIRRGGAFMLSYRISVSDGELTLTSQPLLGRVLVQRFVLSETTRVQVETTPDDFGKLTITSEGRARDAVWAHLVTCREVERAIEDERALRA